MGTKYVFVQQKDGTAGIVLYNATIPAALAVGDEVIIRGTMGTHEGLVQITSGTFEILNSGNTVPLAVDLESTLKAFTVADQSKRFSASGLVVSSAYNSSSRTITVKDASNTAVTIRVELNTDTQLIEVLQELSINDVISISGMHLGWFNGAQFLFGNSSELLIDPLTIENKIKSSITTELDGKSFNEGSEVSLPTELFGVSILWTTNPVDLISGGVFKDVEADLNGATATAVFTVPGRDEVTQVATFTIKDVPAGAEEYTATIASSGKFASGISDGPIPSVRLSIVNPGLADISVSFTKNSSTNTIFNNSSGEIRLYKGGGQLTISVGESFVLTSITIETSKNAGYSIDGGTAITAAGEITILDGSSSSTVIKNVGTDQVRITLITITYRAK